jgi:pyruvate kinase
MEIRTENKIRQIELFGTLGPSCSEVSVLKEMIEEGMTGMRLNLSHSGLTQAAGLIRNYHEAAALCGVSPELLIDLQGPELRIGALQEPVELPDGAVFRLAEDCFENSGDDLPLVPVAQHIIRAMNTGDRVLFDDGAIEAEVILAPDVSGATPLRAQLRVVRGGVLKSRKSLKIVDRSVDGPVLTPQDIQNLQLVREYGVTSVMLPFVRSGRDLRILRAAMEELGCGDLRIFAKIENREGVAHIEDIIPEADMVVIARGDLGNDVPLWELPGVQIDLGEACKAAGKPFLVVTQLLFSMIERPVPTRAEMSDIFYAVTGGASALMLTNETAAGKYPAAAMRYLRLAAEAAMRRM